MVLCLLKMRTSENPLVERKELSPPEWCAGPRLTHTRVPSGQDRELQHCELARECVWGLPPSFGRPVTVTQSDSRLQIPMVRSTKNAMPASSGLDFSKDNEVATVTRQDNGVTVTRQNS